MRCKNCTAKLPAKAKLCPQCGTIISRSANVDVKQSIHTVKGKVVGMILEDNKLSSNFESNTTQKVDVVESGGTLIGTVIGEQAQVGGQRQIVQGDLMIVDKILGNNVSLGHNAQVIAKQGVPIEEITRLFQFIYQKVEMRPEDLQVEKDEITQTIQKIEQETTKGEQANPRKLKHWLKTLVSMAPDIAEVVIATISSPITGISTAVRKVAEKAKSEIGQK